MQIINTLRLIRHGIKVGILSCNIARKNKLKVISWIKLFLAGLFHDIGKLKLNKKILYKKGKVNDEEFNYIKKHVDLGVQLLKKFKVPECIWGIVEQHHESDDGTGYPKGLKSNEISIESKILRTADIYDALTSNRSYRKRYTRQQAIEILINENKDTLISLIS